MAWFQVALAGRVMIVRQFISWIRTAPPAGARAEATRSLARAWLISDLSDDDRIAAEVTKFELNQEQASLAREEYRISHHTVTAAAEGTFNAVRPLDDMVGRYVKEGEILAYVTPASGRACCGHPSLSARWPAVRQRLTGFGHRPSGSVVSCA